MLPAKTDCFLEADPWTIHNHNHKYLDAPTVRDQPDELPEERIQIMIQAAPPAPANLAPTSHLAGWQIRAGAYSILSVVVGLWPTGPVPKCCSNLLLFLIVPLLWVTIDDSVDPLFWQIDPQKCQAYNMNVNSGLLGPRFTTPGINFDRNLSWFQELKKINPGSFTLR